MEEPIIRKLNDTDQPIVSLALSSSVLSPRELTRLADPGITRELRSIPGVAEVDVSGKQERELTVELHPEALQAAGVSVAQVVQALQLQNLAAPVGRLDGTLDERSIRLKGRLAGPAEFEQLVVAERNGRLIRLGDLAAVKDGAEEPRTLALYNDRVAVGIDIKKAKGFSTTEVSDAIMARLERVRATIPSNVQMDIIKDAAIRVARSVREVQVTLFEGALLTVLVVFVFLNSWRSTIITGLALPVSVLAAFIAVWVFGFTLNTMSLLGLSLAIGILIDDAIVVRENIVRHIEMGKDHMTAAKDGTDEIGLAVAATSFSIVAVFVPIAFIYGLAGQWFKPFALTIASSVLVSLFVSFSLDPMLSAYWADPQLEAGERRNPIARTLERFNQWFNRMAINYKSVIAWALDHRVAMVLIAIGSFVGALALPALGLVGASFFGAEDQSEVNIAIETPPGSNLAYTRIKAEEAARMARAHKEVRFTYTTLGGQTGDVNSGNIYVRMLPKSDRSIGAEDFGRQLREEVGRIGGATMSVFTNDFQGAQKQIQLQLRGGSAQQLANAAEAIAEQVKQVN